VQGCSLLLALAFVVSLEGCGAARAASTTGTSNTPRGEARGGAASGSSNHLSDVSEAAAERSEPISEPIAGPVREALDVTPTSPRDQVITGASRHRLVLFTFDDGPHGLYTQRILDTLQIADIRAIFFVVPGRIARGGPRAESEAALLREIAARGHLIGSHTQDHQHLTELDDDAIRYQVVSSEETLASVLGARPTLFRPPGGTRSEASDRILSERGYSQWLWTLVSGDFLTTSPERVLSIFQRSIRGRDRRGLPGGIVLLHDTHRWTADALPEMIAYLWRRNCALLAAGEELYDLSPDPRWYLDEASELVEPPAAELEAHQAALRASAAERCAR